MSNESDFLENQSFDDEQQASDGDLTMDSLPESARFTQSLSFQDFEADLHIDSEVTETNIEFETNERTTNISLYVQTNSKLKLVLLLPERTHDSLSFEILIKDVSEDQSNIVESLLTRMKSKNQKMINLFLPFCTKFYTILPVFTQCSKKLAWATNYFFQVRARGFYRESQTFF